MTIQNDQQNYFLTVIFPTVTLALGFFGNYLIEGAREKHKTKREQEARQITIQDRKTNFQRETLLGLQETMKSITQLTFSEYLRIKKMYQKDKIWNNEIETSVKEEYNKLMFSFVVLKARIFDDKFRTSLNAFHSATTEMINAKTYKDALTARTKAGRLFESQMNYSGELLRKEY